MSTATYSNEFPDALSEGLADIARQIATARRDACGLRDFPGTLPQTLEEAYYVQDRVIEANGRDIAGWKIGRIGEPYCDTLIDRRFSGPIFDGTVVHHRGGVEHLPAIEGGIAFIEAELILKTNAEIGPGHLANPQPDELARHIDTISIGVEIAGTTLRNLPALGPIASICDSGTNVGLVVGEEIRNWRDVSLQEIPCAVTIDGNEVGTGDASNVPGGYLAAFAFLLDICARRGITLPEGTLISSGAITGVHPIGIGGTSRCDFGPFGQIDVEMVKLLPGE